MLILFGTETGNAEDLSFNAGDLSSNFELEAEVKGVDEVSQGGVSECERLMICCNTWSEGEQPDNTHDLYDEISEGNNGCLQGVHFSVQALGDSAFEFFCESGKVWDMILEQKGAKPERKFDCDTDYEDDTEAWISATLALMKNI